MSQYYLFVQIMCVQLLQKQGKIDEVCKVFDNLLIMDLCDVVVVVCIDVLILFIVKCYLEVEVWFGQVVQDFLDDFDLCYDYVMVVEKIGYYVMMEKQLCELICMQFDNLQVYNVFGYLFVDCNQCLFEVSKLIDKVMVFVLNDVYIMDSFGWVKYWMGDMVGVMKVL